MKIAIIIDNLSIGGAERQAAVIAAILARRKYDVTLILLGQQNNYSHILSGSGVKLVEISRKGLLRLQRIRALSSCLKQESFDIIHAFKGVPNITAALSIPKTPSSNLIFGYRAIMGTTILHRFLIKKLSSRASGWIVNSQYVRQFVASYFNVDLKFIHVVPNAIIRQSYESDLTKAQSRKFLGLPDNAKIVSMVANLRKVKNHPMLLRVAKKIVNKGIPTIFILAGDGSERQYLQQLAEDLHIADHVKFLGHFKAIPTLLRATDVAVLTSLTEGLPNAMIEAGAAGLPCVSTDNGGVRDIIIDGKTGYIVPVNNDEVFAERLIHLLSNETKCQSFGRYAKSLVLERFSQKVVLDRLLEAYNLLYHHR